MTIVYIHQGGGCEAHIRQEGNELHDEEVHVYLCPNKDVTALTFEGGFSKRACQEHADKWQARFAASD